MSLQKLEHLIGTSVSDPNLKEFLLSLDGKTRVDSFSGIEIVDYPDRGATIYFDKDQRISAIFFHADADEDHERYDGILPSGLSFRDAKADVARKLGYPSASGTEKSTFAPWERFDFGTYSVHVQFHSDLSSVSMITLMSPAMAMGNT